MQKSTNTHRLTVTLSAEDMDLINQISQLNQGDCNLAIHLALNAWRAHAAEIKRIQADMKANPGSVITHAELKRQLAAKKAALHAMAD